jgi:hypothetical protein
VLDAAAGNPLALIELPAALREQGAPAEALISSAIPLTSRLEQAFASRLLDLPSDTWRVLLVTASDDEGALGEVLAAASVLAGSDLSPESLSPALAIGLVTADEYRIRFCHPLVRSAVLQTASLAERLAAHSRRSTPGLAGSPVRSSRRPNSRRYLGILKRRRPPTDRLNARESLRPIPATSPSSRSREA